MKQTRALRVFILILSALFSACNSIDSFDKSATVESNNVNSNDPWLIRSVFFAEENEECLGKELGYFNGFKYIAAFLMIENNTNSFGYMNTLPIEGITVTTKEGFEYPILGTLESRDIHAGDRTRLIPPGFRVRGYLAGASYDSKGGNKMVFKVANETSGYVINIPSYSPIQLNNTPSSLSALDLKTLFGGIDNGYLFHDNSNACFKTDNTINLSSLFPTSLPDSSFYNIGQTISLSNETEITITNYTRNEDRFSVDIMYKNLSEGYGAYLSSIMYYIGNDGYLRNGGSGGTDVGPNQQETDTYEFKAPESLSNIKFIIRLGVGTREETNKNIEYLIINLK